MIWAGGVRCASMNRVTNSASIAAARWLILWYSVGSAVLSSSRFSVDLPATGAQSRRFAASLPASTASTGSWRS